MSSYRELPSNSQDVNESAQQVNDVDDEVTALINNHNGLATSGGVPDDSPTQQFPGLLDEVTALLNSHDDLGNLDSVPDPSLANPNSIYSTFLSEDISEADLRLLAAAAENAMGANQAGAGSAQSFPPPAYMMAPAPVLAAPAPPSLPVTGSLPLPLPASLPVLGSLPVTGTLPVYAPAPTMLPPPVAPTAQGAGQNVPVPAATARQRRVVDMADPYCCHLCFAVFTGANGVRSHLTGPTTGGGHGWTRAQLTSDPAGRVPNTLSHFSSQGVDTRYTGNNPKQRNNRRRMEQGLTSTSQSYWDDVYGRSGN